jgi:WD40 repeat protein
MKLTLDGQVLAEARLLRSGPNNHYRALARLPERGLLLAGPEGGGMFILDEDTLQPVGSSTPMSVFYDIATTPSNPDLFVTPHEDGLIRLWRISHGDPPILEQVGELSSHSGPVYNTAFHPNGRLLVSVGGGNETRDVRLWDVQNGRELAAFDLFKFDAFAAAFSPDGRWLALGGEADPERADEGAELRLLDLQAADQCLVGNLEYHIARFERENGRTPTQAEAWRAWAARFRTSN